MTLRSGAPSIVGSAKNGHHGGTPASPYRSRHHFARSHFSTDAGETTGIIPSGARGCTATSGCLQILEAPMTKYWSQSAQLLIQNLSTYQGITHLNFPPVARSSRVSKGTSDIANITSSDDTRHASPRIYATSPSPALKRRYPYHPQRTHNRRA
jgi:hypothetical protein